MEEKSLSQDDLQFILTTMIDGAKLLPHGPYQEYEIRAKYGAAPIEADAIVYVVQNWSAYSFL